MWNEHYPNYLDSIGQDQKILLAPLNWGLGHATRCIPIIHDLLDRGNEVVLGSDGLALELLRREFPGLQHIELPSYNIDYTGGFTFSFLKQLPKVLLAIRKEGKYIAKLQREYNFDIIISDNRYGARLDHIRSIILIHQLQIKFGIPLIQEIGKAINRRMINRFDECWIPDFPDYRSIAGDLSKTYGIENAKYIGALSRLSIDKKKATQDIGIILSGPEPNRTDLERKLHQELCHREYRISIIRGTARSSSVYWGKHKTIDLANSNEVKELIETSKLIITRSGYTTLMDLYGQDIPTILIPTTGQSEQEYLANICQAPFIACKENKLNQIDELIQHQLSKSD